MTLCIGTDYDTTSQVLAQPMTIVVTCYNSVAAVSV